MASLAKQEEAGKMGEMHTKKKPSKSDLEF